MLDRAPDNDDLPRLENISGQLQAKRALVISIAGGHNLHMSGPPGTGKTMLAKAASALLLPMDKDQVLELSKIYALSEFMDRPVSVRPFRSPHHTASTVSIIGGGQPAKPGEASLAHLGILFLDEMPEFSKSTLDALRQPLEDKMVSISRAKSKLNLPADFILIATSNPCPCGYSGDKDIECKCAPYDIERYNKRVSGPILDRIDLSCQVERVVPGTIINNDPEDSLLTTRAARQLIERAKSTQQKRYQGQQVKSNNQISADYIRKSSLVDNSCKEFIDQAAAKLHLSPRSYIRVIRVARTIADVKGAEDINTSHIAEALAYRT